MIRSENRITGYFPSSPENSSDEGTPSPNQEDELTPEELAEAAAQIEYLKRNPPTEEDAEVAKRLKRIIGPFIFGPSEETDEDQQSDA